MSLDVRVAEMPRHLALDLGFVLAHAAPAAAQLRARVLAELAGGSDHLGERALERVEDRQRLGQPGEQRRALAVAEQRSAHAAQRLERARHGRQLAGGGGAAARQLRERRAQVCDPAERRLGSVVAQNARLAGLAQPLPYTGVRRREVERAQRLGAALGRRLRGEQLEQARPLQARERRGFGAKRHGTGL